MANYPANPDSSTLTDEERAAVTTSMHAYGENNADEECAEIEATLWGLLERTLPGRVSDKPDAPLRMRQVLAQENTTPP